MPFTAINRLQREFSDLAQSEEVRSGNFKVELVNDNWLHIMAEIAGPHDTPYEGGRFELEIKVPPQYPFKPPNIKFISHVWHPNISSVTGIICVDVLKEQWSAALTLRTILLSIQVLLSAPEPDDPQDVVVACQYKRYHEMFVKTARHWTNAYAKGPHVIPEYDEMVKQLVEKGMNAHLARTALSNKNWVVSDASKYFLWC